MERNGGVWREMEGCGEKWRGVERNRGGVERNGGVWREMEGCGEKWRGVERNRGGVERNGGVWREMEEVWREMEGGLSQQRHKTLHLSHLLTKLIGGVMVTLTVVPITWVVMGNVGTVSAGILG